MQRIRMMKKTMGLLLLILASWCGYGAAQDIPAHIQAAVADPIRPGSDTQRDPDRKPGQVLAFAGVKPGDKVGELMPGRGYFTKLFCKIVGDEGHVYTVNVTRSQSMGPPPGGGQGGGRPPMAQPEEQPSGEPCTNVTEDAHLAAEFQLPSGLDMVWTSENYHDLYNAMFGSPDMLMFNRAVFDALKPGGVYMVEDHRAEAGSGSRDTDTYHRIDPQQVIDDVTAVGFVLEAQSDVLNNPDDPLNVRTSEVEQGVSSKFLLKFRKPL